MAETAEEHSQQLVALTSRLLGAASLAVTLDSERDVVLACSSTSVLVACTEALLGQKLDGIIRRPITAADRASNIEVIVETLASQVLHTELTHISGQRVVQGDLTDISNLVEILAALTFVATPLDAAGECGLVRQSTQMLLALEVFKSAPVHAGQPAGSHLVPRPAASVDSETLVSRCSAGHCDSEDQGSDGLAAELAELPGHSSMPSAQVAEPASLDGREDHNHLTGLGAHPRGALQHDLLRANDEQEAALLQRAGAAAQDWHQAGGADSGERCAQAGEAAGHWAQPEVQQQEQPQAVQTGGDQWTQQLEAVQSDVQEWAEPGGHQNLNWDHGQQTEQQQAAAGSQTAPESTSSDEQWQDAEGADENAGSTVLQQQHQAPVQHRGGGKRQQQRCKRAHCAARGCQRGAGSPDEAGRTQARAAAPAAGKQPAYKLGRDLSAKLEHLYSLQQDDPAAVARKQRLQEQERRAEERRIALKKAAWMKQDARSQQRAVAAAQGHRFQARRSSIKAAQLTAQAQALAKSLSLQRNAAEEAHFKEAFLAAVEAEKERLLASRRRPAGQPLEKGLPQAGAGQDAVEYAEAKVQWLQELHERECAELEEMLAREYQERVLQEHEKDVLLSDLRREALHAQVAATKQRLVSYADISRHLTEIASHGADATAQRIQSLIKAIY
eukprot:jgi/Astpho2/8315/Aster-x1511